MPPKIELPHVLACHDDPLRTVLTIDVDIPLDTQHPQHDAQALYKLRKSLDEYLGERGGYHRIVLRNPGGK